jgi:hypothetical protein
MVAGIIVDEMKKLDMHYPPAAVDLEEFRKELENEDINSIK